MDKQKFENILNMTYDVAFRYKMKDSRGLVVTSDLWTGSDLVVGDAVERRIYFNDIPKGSRIEFSDNL